jgi:RNA polymerase sigma factor (sigma-70 family)
MDGLEVHQYGSTSLSSSEPIFLIPDKLALRPLMYEAYADQGEASLPKTPLDTFLPQISLTVRWACRCYHRFPDQSVIDDLTQEILLSLIRNDFHDLHSFEHRATAKTWLQVVVLHRVGRHFQSQKPTESLEDLPLDSLLSQPPSQEEAVLIKEWEELVGIARGELTKREQELWDLLRGGRRDEEIAKRMSIKIKSVQRRKHALLKKIRSLMKHWGVVS